MKSKPSMFFLAAYVLIGVSSAFAADKEAPPEYQDAVSAAANDRWGQNEPDAARPNLAYFAHKGTGSEYGVFDLAVDGRFVYYTGTTCYREKVVYDGEDSNWYYFHELRAPGWKWRFSKSLILGYYRVQATYGTASYHSFGARSDRHTINY